jgi:hypothetical protein
MDQKQPSIWLRIQRIDPLASAQIHTNADAHRSLANARLVARRADAFFGRRHKRRIRSATLADLRGHLRSS